ncbi:hypothetical protein AB0I53_23445 [Saccharopolyspora sp. NPDC050389]|uniref:hypothetical protein n=1 Tax=Saccharopolyspora sp. NPDC050389 TaxID=3155516 RepID=UPI0033F43D86
MRASQLPVNRAACTIPINDHHCESLVAGGDRDVPEAAATDHARHRALNVHPSPGSQFVPGCGVRHGPIGRARCGNPSVAPDSPGTTDARSRRTANVC